MDIAVLCTGAFLATVGAWMYLNVHRPNANEIEDEQESTAEPSEPAEVEKVTEAPAKLFAKPSGRRTGFLVAMLLILCAMAISLKNIYPGNTLVENAKLLSLLAILFVAANTDARYRIIPNGLVITGLVLRVVFWIIELLVEPAAIWGIMKSDLIACLLVIVFVGVSVLMVKGGIGMGDVKLMLVMCLFQGFYGVISSLFCSLFVAFVYAIIVLLFKKKSKKDSVAFAPAILLGTIISVFLTGM